MGGTTKRQPEADAATLPSIVLREADTDRARQAYWSAAMLCAIGAAGLRLYDGPQVLGWTTSIVVAAAGLVCAVMAWRRRDGSLFSHGEATVMGLMICAAALGASAHVGPFSAGVVGVVLFVIILGMGDVQRGRALFLVTFLGYCGLAALVVAGYLPAITPTVSEASTFELGVSSVLIGIMVAMAYVFGRTARRTTTEALTSLHRARLAIAGRDALLQEARADLARLLEGRHGRLTGHQIDGYQLGELLGRGGNGEVYRGQSADAGSQVAVKVLHPNLVTEDTEVDRFFREARVASSLDSPHLVCVHGLGIGPDGAPYIVMEMLEGRSLAELLRADGPMTLDDAAVLVSHVADGLAAAHRAGIVHRDIKPGNLLRVEEGGRVMWKIVDFGISKLMAGSGTLTQGDLLGTPGYMAPEQVDGLNVDERADVFGLGAVLYRAITGRPPFSGGDPIAVAVYSTQHQPLRPSALCKLPQDVDRVLALALTKEPELRFASARELAEALLQALHGGLDPVIRERARAYLVRRPWSERAAPPMVDVAPGMTTESATRRM